jgi:hypothetical protein
MQAASRATHVAAPISSWSRALASWSSAKNPTMIATAPPAKSNGLVRTLERAPSTRS